MPCGYSAAAAASGAARQEATFAGGEALRGRPGRRLSAAWWLEAEIDAMIAARAEERIEKPIVPRPPELAILCSLS